MVDSLSKKPSRSRAKFQPAIGRDFDNIVSVVQVLDQYRTSRTKDRVAYLVLGCGVGAVGLAAVYGMITGSFSGLRDVWGAVGPIVGGVIGYYFHRSRKELK